MSAGTPLRRVLFAEALGTFALVFAGTGAAAVNEATGGAVTHVGVSLAFGLVVLAMIQAVGEVSGAHLNPAVPFDVVATVCEHAREACPFVPARRARVHESFPDPAKATGTEADVTAAFRASRDAIRAWAEALVAEHVGAVTGPPAREETGA